MASNLSVPTVKNYISSIKSFFKAKGFHVTALESHQLSLALSSLSKNWSPPITIKPVLSPHQFIQLLVAASQLPLHIFYQNAFILGFLGLLRISNVAPVSLASFDPLRHLRRCDVTANGNSVIVHLRWTKTLQRYRQSSRVQLLAVPNSPVCPLRAFQALQRSFPVLPTDPFLSYRASGLLFIISQSQLRSALKRLPSTLNLSPHLTFHSFRRSVPQFFSAVFSRL
jgi:integrase